MHDYIFQVEKDWRVVQSFSDDQHQTTTDENVSSDKMKRLDFDASQYKSLNAELKYLYTAITRAKCHLWIYDSNRGKSGPVFDYWIKNSLVEVIQIDDISKDTQNTLFSVTSSPEKWKSQGDYFKRKSLWEQAIKCYQKANCFHLARAYSLVQQVQVKQASTPSNKRDLKEIKEKYLEAAHAFLKSDQLEHDYECLNNAAICLKKAKEIKKSSKLYILLGQVSINMLQQTLTFYMYVILFCSWKGVLKALE